jgi:hypothetical protein
MKLITNLIATVYLYQDILDRNKKYLPDTKTKLKAKYNDKTLP